MIWSTRLPIGKLVTLINVYVAVSVVQEGEAMPRQLPLRGHVHPCDPEETRREELEICVQERESLQTGIAWVCEEVERAPTLELHRALTDLRAQMAALEQAIAALSVVR